MDLHRIIAVFLVTGMVNAINVTSHGQQSQFEELKHEVEDLSRSLTSALTYIHQKCTVRFAFLMVFVWWQGVVCKKMTFNNRFSLSSSEL